MCKVSSQSVQPFQRRFLKVLCFLNNMAAESRDQWRHQQMIVNHFNPRWPSIIFLLIGCSVPHMQLWCHNEGTYDVTKIPHSFSMRSTCYVTLVHPWLVEHLCEVSSRFIQPLWRRRFFIGFRINPIWLPNHVNNDITCVNLLFLMERRSYL